MEDVEQLDWKLVGTREVSFGIHDEPKTVHVLNRKMYPMGWRSNRRSRFCGSISQRSRVMLFSVLTDLIDEFLMGFVTALSNQISGISGIRQQWGYGFPKPSFGVILVRKCEFVLLSLGSQSRSSSTT